MQKLFRAWALALIFAPALAFAGGAGSPGGQSPMDRMAEQLGLSEDQQSEIESIIQEQREKQMQLQQKTQQRIDEVLTDDQRAKLEEIQQQRQAEMRRRLEEMKKQRQGEGNAP